MHNITLLFRYIWYLIYSYFYKETTYYSKPKDQEITSFIPYNRYNKKPPWVKDKIVYLKVNLPQFGCRKIATAFNQQYTDVEMSVSKSYVYKVFKELNQEILEKRKAMSDKKPTPVANNHIWHMDLTTVHSKQILGVVDGGSRALLSLKHLVSKSSLNILISLLELIRDYGKPKSIRSDNEIVFTSRLMRVSLWLLGIQRQTTQIASPWQNGKIERLFGTMKQSFKNLEFPITETLIDAIAEFRLYYNHMRPHQNLEYNTPSNAWDNKLISTSKSAREIEYFSGLCGNIAGYYYRE